MHCALRVSIGVLLLAITGAAQQRLEAPSTVFIVTGANATALYHRQGCPALLTGGNSFLTLSEAQKRHFQPHCACITGKDGAPPCDAAAIAPDPVAAATA